MPIFFVGKMLEAFAVQKLLSFFQQKKSVYLVGLNIFYFLNKHDNISIHCNLQITGSERKQEYLYSSSPEHIKFVKCTGRILIFQYKVY